MNIYYIARMNAVVRAPEAEDARSTILREMRLALNAAANLPVTSADCDRAISVLQLCAWTESLEAAEAMADALRSRHGPDGLSPVYLYPESGPWMCPAGRRSKRSRV
jgi:hypothetical protein